MKMRYFDIAKKMAIDNPSDFKMAAIFVPRKGNEWYGGLNSIWKSHPLSKTLFKNIHAEMAALIEFGFWNMEGIAGGEMYVLRLATYGLAPSMPCLPCQNLLRKFKIKKAHYTTRQGYETMRIC